jgi:hypothetical protein
MEHLRIHLNGVAWSGRAVLLFDFVYPGVGARMGTPDRLAQSPALLLSRGWKRGATAP